MSKSATKQFAKFVSAREFFEDGKRVGYRYTLGKRSFEIVRKRGKNGLRYVSDKVGSFTTLGACQRELFSAVA
ncbi:MAG: hypothetical protein ACM31O_03810 [Bacteroidota bacterium]